MYVMNWKINSIWYAEKCIIKKEKRCILIIMNVIKMKKFLCIFLKYKI